VLQPVTYHLPRYSFQACRVFTNKPPCGPKRGHGTPQPRFGQEIQIDKIAEKLQMDPAEFRLGQVEKPDSLTANYLKIGTIGLAECIERVVDKSGWKSKHRKLPTGQGVGLACSAYMSGAGTAIYWNKMPHSGVQLKLDRSGLVTVYCGATEVGQGSDDVLVGLVAEVLGLEPIDIRCVTGDTDLTPVDLGSYSSRVTLMMGNAAIQAAGRARELIAGAVAEKLDIPVDQLAFAEGRVFDVGEPSSGMTFRGGILCATKSPCEIPGRRRRPLPNLFLLGGGGRSRRGHRDRFHRDFAGLHRARHRPVVESGVGGGPGHRRCLYGDR